MESRHRHPTPAAALFYSLTPFVREGLAARSLCSVMWPLFAPLAMPDLAMVASVSSEQEIGPREKGARAMRDGAPRGEVDTYCIFVENKAKYS